MAHTLNVQELIDICKLHPENESARNLCEDLEKAQVNHAKAQEKFDIDFFVRLWSSDITLKNESGEINIRKKLSSDTNVVKYIEDILNNIEVVFENEKGKALYETIMVAIKEKIDGAKTDLLNNQKSSVVIAIEDKEVDFSLAVYRTGNIISFTQSSLGKLDFSKQGQ